MIRKFIEEYHKWGPDININQTENICVGGEKSNLTLESGQEIKCCAKYKYLGVDITNKGTLYTTIKERNLLGKKTITVPDGILWDRNINSSNKKLTYNIIMKSIITYSCEIWPIKETTERMLEEMDFW